MRLYQATGKYQFMNHACSTRHDFISYKYCSKTDRSLKQIYCLNLVSTERRSSDSVTLTARMKLTLVCLALGLLVAAVQAVPVSKDVEWLKDQFNPDIAEWLKKRGVNQFDPDIIEWLKEKRGVNQFDPDVIEWLKEKKGSYKIILSWHFNQLL